MIFKKVKVKNFLKIIPFLFLFFSPVITLADEIKGSGWFATEKDGDKKIILFDKDGSFTFLNVISQSGNEGRVFSGVRNTWKEEENNKLILSFNDGYKLCSLIREDWSREIINGSCINKAGNFDYMQLRLIK